jgi:hypothetical protein
MALVSESGASILSGSGAVSFREGADIGRLNRGEFGERPKEVKETGRSGSGTSRLQVQGTR